jgi:hypothetical protein
MKKARIYKCFIASPSDTFEERGICDRVFKEINETQGEQFDFRIESKKWEDNARPSFGDSPQEVINEQLLNEFELFIGIMFTRFGSPTKNADSGTVEEFNFAYQNREKIEIMFYFNSKNISQEELDTSQFSKVKEFKIKLTELGGLYSKYIGVEEFEEKLRKNLQRYFSSIYKPSLSSDNSAEEDTVASSLQNRLLDALSTFSDQPEVWVKPVIYEDNKSKDRIEGDKRVEINVGDLIKNPFSIIIKSPPQFGLTCLAHHLSILAWSKKSVWIYLDMNKVNIQTEIGILISREQKKLGLENKPVACIILDSWKPSTPGSMKILRGICNKFPDTPVVVMMTIGDFGPNVDADIKIKRDFRKITLSELSRNSIRKVVSDYNKEKNIGDEDAILDKVVKDIEVLNIHRTPMNCLTLLKISEKHFDESPVNRTKMIEMFLFVLFDLVDLPTYQTKPDVKDCEHVLGYFCEKLIKNNIYEFSKDIFIQELNDFCEEKLLDLEVTIVFDVLLENRIIVNSGNKLRFKAIYWVYYFAANQMHVNKDFYEYVISNDIYTSFPEIIEFYTGIDRKSSDIINVLTEDLAMQCNIVEEKTGMTLDFNPLNAMEWNPTEKHIKEAKELINTEVLNSKLPDSLKDEYADKNYNYEKPFNQEVSYILEEYTFLILRQKIIAASRALRNSDYVDSKEKKLLLREITRGWHLFSKILFVLSPIMAKHDYASFDGLGFILDGFKIDDIDEKITQILAANPLFVVNFFKDDLFSPKSAPLLYDAISSENNKLIKHELILVLIYGRPKEWSKHVKTYIAHLPRNSVYLLDVLQLLKNRCKYDFINQRELSDMGSLLKMCYAKHEFKGGNLLDQSNQISNSVIPKRSDD